MIPVPSGVRVWIAAGHTDMRCGMNSLALRIQQALQRDPHGGDLYVFRGKSGKLIKIFWYDGLGASLYAKRLERGRFVWPSTIEPFFDSVSTSTQRPNDGSMRACFDDIHLSGTRMCSSVPARSAPRSPPRPNATAVSSASR